MVKLLLNLLNLPLPVLLLGVAGCFLLFLVVIILVACVPSAGERLSRFLALLEEVFYSGSTAKSSYPVKRPSQRRQRKCEEK